jgi:hypothetical protein
VAVEDNIFEVSTPPVPTQHVFPAYSKFKIWI